MPTLGTSGIFFDEDDGSPQFKGSLSNGTFQAIQRGYGNWSDVNSMVSYLMAPSLVFGQIFGVYAGAAFPDNSLLRCVDWNIVPADTITGATSNGVNTHTTAYWTITYQNIKAPYRQQDTQDPVPMLTHEWDIGGEFVVPKQLSLRWPYDSTSAGNDVRAGIFVPTQEITVSWPRLTVPPFQAVRALAGKVNNADFTFDTGVMAFETALFLGARVRRDVLSDGTLAWQFAYKFSQKQVPAADSGTSYNYGAGAFTQSTVGGWNHYFRSDYSKPGFYRLQLTQTAAGSPCIYQHGDFTKLFKADQAVSEQGT